jgi:hypothetical protein
MPSVRSRLPSRPSRNTGPLSARSTSSSEFPRREPNQPAPPPPVPISFDEFLTFLVDGEPYIRLLNTFANDEDLVNKINHIYHCIRTAEDLRTLVRRQLDSARRLFHDLNYAGGQELLIREYRRPRRLVARRPPTPYRPRPEPVVNRQHSVPIIIRSPSYEPS